MKIIYFLIFILISLNAHAFGISPSSFEVRLQNNYGVEKEFTLINDDFETKEFEISSYGIDFINFTKFNLKIGPQSQENVKFLIGVPYETSEGIYEGRIYVNKIKPEEGGVNLDALLGIKVEVEVESNFTGDYFADSIKLNSGNEILQEDKYDFLDSMTENPEIILFYALTIVLCIICAFFIANRLFLS